MKTSLFFTQRKPLTVKILGVVLLVFSILIFFEEGSRMLEYLIVLVLSSILLGYSFSFEISKDLSHKRHFKLFGITLFKQRLDVFSPEYIVVFSVTSGKSSEWGPIAAMGNTNKESSFVIRLFRENQKFTVWRTSSSSQAQRRAMELSQLLGVEIRS
jgi:hypothetical protein